MSLLSVNTNRGAMVALQSLAAINRELSVTQNRISTGKKINSAKDNGAVWAIARGSDRNPERTTPSSPRFREANPPLPSAWPRAKPFPTC